MCYAVTTGEKAAKETQEGIWILTPQSVTTSPRRIRKQLLRDAQDHKLEQLNLDVQDQIDMRYHLVKQNLEVRFPDMLESKIHETANEISAMNRRERRARKVRYV